ncbi:hypothetical protein IMZ48_05625, partial [Candidatus Bathyarchaeota archaeon]|nr:hypothetical protein [Candidatus Bathyarchaeota archaeon]
MLTRHLPHAQVPSSEAAAHNVEPKPDSILNGSRTADEIENKRITSVEEQTTSTDVSASGGSDTEAVKCDGSQPTLPLDGGHARTSSTAKKPAAFKAVSVNKTFLASKAAASKPGGDKSPAAPGTPGVQTPRSALASSRPRLV